MKKTLITIAMLGAIISAPFIANAISVRINNAESIEVVEDNGDVVGARTGPTKFVGLSDTPDTYTASQCVAANAGGTALEYVTCGVTSTSTGFLYLTDTPSSYSGQTGLCTAVNGTEDALEFVACGSGGASSASGVFATTTNNLIAYMRDGEDSNPYRMVIGSNASTTNVYFEMNDGASSTDGYIAVGSNAGNVLILDENGQLGLNDNTPSYLLDVNGTFNATGAATLGSTLAVTGTSAFTGNITSLGTLTGQNLVATSSLDIPSGAAPTVDAEGEVAIDTTAGQLVDFTTAKRVVDEDGIRSWCYTFASSTDIVSGDYREIMEFPYNSSTIYYQTCKAQDGTSLVVNLSDGTNDMTSITCANTTATGTPSSNNTFTGGASAEDVRIEFGTNTGNVQKGRYCAYYRIDAQ